MKNHKVVKEKEAGRVIGLDCHPDSFTAAILRGTTPASAIVEQTFDKIPLDQLESWTRKHVTSEDQVLLEASGNSFQVVRLLQKAGAHAEVLESGHLGKLKEAHANNDKISAVRIAKAWLAGTAKKVWVPDEVTQQRRDWYHAHAKAVKRTTQTRNRLLSYLSDNGVRLPKGTRLATGKDSVESTLRSLQNWSDKQWQVIQILWSDLQQAEVQRVRWCSLIAQEVAADPLLLSMLRLCGVRVVVAFALGAIVGDIHRFAGPKALVKYVGLSPAFDDSGQGKWSGGVGGHGRKDLRNLLIQAAQSILRSRHPMARWGLKLLARKGVRNLVVAAMARKLTVAIWYLMMGRWTEVEEIDTRLKGKVGTLITTMGKQVLQARKITRRQLREQLSALLQTGRTYLLKDPLPAAT